MLRDVVITGLGIVSPIGIGREAFWAALEAGHSGISELQPYAEAGLPFRYGGQIKDFDAKAFVQPRKTIKVMCREIQTGYAAAMLALTDAGLSRGQVDPDRLGVVMGSELFHGEGDELIEVFRHAAKEGQFQIDRWGETAFKDLFPLWMLKYLPNMPACHIGIAVDARGPNNTIVQGGVSSLLAVLEGTLVIERGHADAMIVGGTGSNLAASSLPFRGWEHLSRWKGLPAGACRPFERDRSGIVPGEGAGALVLESREHAQRRGANILARVLGFSARCEPLRPGCELEGRAIAQSIAAALSASNLQPRDVGHVNAHGESTLEGDRREAQAVHSVLGSVPVTAPKSFFGDLAAGSGAVELAASVLATLHGRIPPTLNYHRPDPACSVHVVHGEPLSGRRPTALVLNQSRLGQAVAVAIGEP
jgi:3-oxoacyl-[acyl-carrier-protein] synthase II